MKDKPVSKFLQEETIKDRQKIEKYILKHFDINKAQFDTKPESFILSPKEYKKLRKLSFSMEKGKDMTFTIGYRWFYNVRLNIKKGVFVPQSDTEGLIDLVLNEYKASRKDINVLEIGAGAGAISIALAKNNKRMNIDSLDISSKALELATYNAVVNTVLQRINYTKHNFLKVPVEKQYDVIISNPPYIDKRDKGVEKWVKKHQPHTAIYAKHKGVDFYHKIFTEAERILVPGGKIFLEIGEDQRDILKPIIPKIFKSYKFHRDINKKFRYLVLEKK